MKPEWKKSTVIPIIEDKKVQPKSDTLIDPLRAAATVFLLTKIKNNNRRV